MSAPARSLQVRILASVLLGLGVVLLGFAALAFGITNESTQHSLSERLALARAVQEAADREIRDAVDFAERLAATPEVRAGRDLSRLLTLADHLEAAEVTDSHGAVLASAGRHGAARPWPAGALAGLEGARVVTIPGPEPRIGVVLPLGHGRVLAAQLGRDRLASLLAPLPGTDHYAAQLIGPDGSSIAATPLPAQWSAAHAALVGSLRARGQAGVVLHAIRGQRLDHYLAYAPLAMLPGWGVVMEQPRDVVVALPLRLRDLILSVGLVTLVAGGAVAWLDVRRVVTPLRTLTRDAERIGSGDLATPIASRAGDEVGMLAQSLDHMRTALHDSLDEIHRRETRASALHEVGIGILKAQERDAALRPVVGAARDLLGGDVALLCLYDGAPDRVLPVAVAGDADAVTARPGQPEVCPPGPLVACGVLSPAYRTAHLVAAVRAGERALGWLCVGARTPRAYTAEDRRLLESLGSLAALALENLRLRGEVQWLGALEERERLARELHDGLAQSLGVIYANARSGGEVVPRATLDAIAEISSRAYDEVRQAIFGLRLPRRADLASAIREYLREFTRQTGVPVEFVVEDGAALALPISAEVQAIRIVQEALANVMRHAHAARASVRFGREDDDAVITVEDDGVGFTAGQAGDGRPHFGLLTMRERAESVGGSLVVASAPGAGARVTARLPLRREVRAWTRSG